MLNDDLNGSVVYVCGGGCGGGVVVYGLKRTYTPGGQTLIYCFEDTCIIIYPVPLVHHHKQEDRSRCVCVCVCM